MLNLTEPVPKYCSKITLWAVRRIGNKTSARWPAFPEKRKRNVWLGEKTTSSQPTGPGTLQPRSICEKKREKRESPKIKIGVPSGTPWKRERGGGHRVSPKWKR